VETVNRRPLPCDHSSCLFTTSFHQSRCCGSILEVQGDVAF
nr:hypothetical protein [Tanacetum cinerariifolium]